MTQSSQQDHQQNLLIKIMPKSQSYINNPQIIQDINSNARKYKNILPYFARDNIRQKQTEIDVFLELKYQQVFHDLPKAYLVVNFLDLYCVIEQSKLPYLKNVPFVIRNENIVMACNAEARKYNIRPGDSIENALKSCKYLKIIDGDNSNYYDSCKKLDAILREFDQDYQVLGLDSALLDVTAKVFQGTKTQSQYPYHSMKSQCVNQSQQDSVFWNVDNPTSTEYQALSLVNKLKKKLEVQIGNTLIGVSFTPQLAALCAKSSNQHSTITKLTFASHIELQTYSRNILDQTHINFILQDIIEEPNDDQWGNGQLQSFTLNQFLGLCVALNIESINSLYEKRGILDLVDPKRSKRILQAICGLLDQQKVIQNTHLQFKTFIFELETVNIHDEQQNLKIQLLKLCKQICSKLQNERLLCTDIDLHLIQSESRMWKVQIPIIPNSDQLQDIYEIFEALLVSSRRNPPYELNLLVQTRKNVPTQLSHAQSGYAGFQGVDKKKSGPLMKFLLNNQRSNEQVSFGTSTVVVQLPGVPLGVPSVVSGGAVGVHGGSGGSKVNLASSGGSQANFRNVDDLQTEFNVKKSKSLSLQPESSGTLNVLKEKSDVIKSIVPGSSQKRSQQVLRSQKVELLRPAPVSKRQGTQNLQTSTKRFNH